MTQAPYTEDELRDVAADPEHARAYYLDRAAWMLRTADAKRVDAMKFAMGDNYAEAERVAEEADEMERIGLILQEQIESLVGYHHPQA